MCESKSNGCKVSAEHLGLVALTNLLREVFPRGGAIQHITVAKNPDPPKNWRWNSASDKTRAAKAGGYWRREPDDVLFADLVDVDPRFACLDTKQLRIGVLGLKKNPAGQWVLVMSARVAD